MNIFSATRKNKLPLQEMTLSSDISLYEHSVNFENDMLKESSNIDLNMALRLGQCLSENVDFFEFLSEGKGADFLKNIVAKTKKYIKKIWEFIKNLWRNLISRFDVLLKENKKFVDKYKSALTKVNQSGFEYEGYEWTGLDSADIKSINANVYDSLDNSMKDMGNIDDMSDDDIDKLDNNKKNFQDELYSKILSGATKSNFENKYEKHIKGSESTKTIKSIDVNKYCDVLNNMKTEQANCKEAVSMANTAYNDTIKFIEIIEDEVSQAKDNDESKKKKATKLITITKDYCGYYSNSINVVSRILIKSYKNRATQYKKALGALFRHGNKNHSESFTDNEFGFTDYYNKI